MSKKSTIVIYGTKSMKKNNTIYVNEKDFQNPFYNYEYNLIPLNELKKVQKTTLEGKLLMDLFVHENISLWWLFYPHFASKFLTIIPFIDNFEKFLTNVQPSIVKIKNDFSNFDIIKQICENNEIIIKYSKFDFIKFKTKQKIKFIARKYRSKSKIEKKINQRIKLYHKYNTSIPNVNDAILFTSFPSFHRQNLNIQTGLTEKGEYFIQNLIDLFENKEKIIGIDQFSHVSSDNTVLEERLKSNIPWLPIEILLKKRKINIKNNKLLENYDRIINSKEFQKIFVFKKQIWFMSINIHDFFFVSDIIPFAYLQQNLSGFFANRKSFYQCLHASACIS